MSAEEQEKLRQAVRDAANQGVFTPSSHLRHHIQFPGAWGGANWGSTAADPATRDALRSQPRDAELSADGGEQPSALAQPVIKGGPREQEGYAVYTQHCAACHGPGQTPMRSPAKLGAGRFPRPAPAGQRADAAHSRRPRCLPRASTRSKRICSACRWRMRPRSRRRGRLLRLPQNPNRYTGPATRYAGSFSAGWYTSNGLPTVGPPWTQLVAYDLNEGTIKWRVPDGHAPGLADERHHEHRHRSSAQRTGGHRRRAGVRRRTRRTARSAPSTRDTGRVLWARELEANPEGIPAVYEVGGRQYLAFAAGASWGTGGDPVWRNAFHRKQGRIEAQGYHVFALPAATRPCRQSDADGYASQTVTATQTTSGRTTGTATRTTNTGVRSTQIAQTNTDATTQPDAPVRTDPGGACRQRPWAGR